MVKVVKKSGELDVFSKEKFIQSIINSGASKDVANKVYQHISPKLYDGIETKKIYRWARRALKKLERTSASRYDLKESLMRLGPAGYAFERYVAKLFDSDGYKTRTNQIIQGECITHEIDVVLEKNGKRTLVECKHHVHGFEQIRIQTLLYVYARFLDLKKHFDDVIIATNTRFSKQSVHYALCKNIGVLGWGFPKTKGIETLIDSKKLFPITVLHELQRPHIEAFEESNILTVEEVNKLSDEQIMRILNVPESKAARIKTESNELIIK